MRRKERKERVKRLLLLRKQNRWRVRRKPELAALFRAMERYYALFGHEPSRIREKL